MRKKEWKSHINDDSNVNKNPKTKTKGTNWKARKGIAQSMMLQRDAKPQAARV